MTSLVLGLLCLELKTSSCSLEACYQVKQGFFHEDEMAVVMGLATILDTQTAELVENDVQVILKMSD